MQCPKCKKKPLKSCKVTAKQLMLDQCELCRGIWLDKDELGELLGAKAKKDFSIPSFSTQLQNVDCPRCHVSLREFCYPDTLVLVDACKQCEGVWLDNNEWKAISRAREQSNKMACPKCHTVQAKAVSCTKCAVVIAKYQPNTSTESVPKKADTADKSYADDIPGLKGDLLRMIDAAIKRLSSGLF